MDEFEITISSPPEKEELVADLFYGNYTLLTINEEKGPKNLFVEIYHYPEVGNWKFDLNRAIKNIKLAQKKLLSVEGLNVTSPKEGLGKFRLEQSREKIRILYEKIPFATIDREQIIEFYPHPKEKWWTFSLDEMWNAFDEAKKLLFTA